MLRNLFSSSRVVSAATAITFGMLVFGASSAQAGFYTEHETIVPMPQGDPIKKRVRAWHDGKKFKKENPLNGETIIIDLDTKYVYGVNFEKKSYWQLGSKDYQRVAVMQLFAMGVMMTPDGKLQVSDNLFSATGKTKDVGGKQAYEVKINYPPIPNAPPGTGMNTSIWLSEEVELPKEKLIDELRITLNNPKGPEYTSLFNQWRALDGYPVLTETNLMTPKGNISSTETLKIYRKQKMSASEFKVPKGFKKTDDPITKIKALQKQMAERKRQEESQGGGRKGTVKKAGAK